MSAEIALLVVLGAPLLHAALVALLPRPPGLRDVVHIGFSLAAAIAAVRLVQAAASGEHLRVSLAHLLPNVDFAFSIEPLGAAMTAAVTWLAVLHAIHAAGMARAGQDPAPARLMALNALAMAAAVAAMLAANLLTFFVAYQALTLATFPMVAHRGDEAARCGAQTYLAILLTASIGLLLPAMVWTYALAGLEFRTGGVLAGKFEDAVAPNVLLALFVFGLAKTAIPPVHGWLSASANAPFAGLAPIQALTVLPVGGVGIIKVAAYVFGAALPQAEIAARGLLVLAGAAMCIAALAALSKQDLRERLAYSALAQSMGVVAGALLAATGDAFKPQGVFAATLQIVALTMAASTLLMAIGTVHAATGRTTARDFAGLGRIMPWTIAGFALACASMIGMPPFAGAWAKLWLITAAADSNLHWAAILLGASAVLTFAHLAPLAATAFAAPAPADAFKRPDGASLMLVGPVVLAAMATLLLILFADPFAYYLRPLWSAPT